VPQPSTTSASASVVLAAGDLVTCTYRNTKRARFAVIKTVAGQPPSGSQSFDFQVRTGASASAVGMVIGTGRATAGNGGQLTIKDVTNPTMDLLIVPGTYQFCEFILPGWSNPLGASSFVPGIATDSTIDNAYQCSSFTLAAGETRTLRLDNRPPPGGQGKTIGFWKNWASCSGAMGKQKPILDQILQLGDIRVGTLVLHDANADPNIASDCQAAVRLLNKSRVDNGKKMSSDPAFNFAAQYLAYKLNIAAGANSGCSAANGAATSGQSILVAITFNGSTHTNISKTQASQLNQFAATLDRYNNNTLAC
jgi:hypothetical protein